MTPEQHRAYRRAWDQLSQEERMTMAKHGIHSPLSENFSSVNHDAEAPIYDGHTDPEVYNDDETPPPRTWSAEEQEAIEARANEFAKEIARTLTEKAIARYLWVMAQSRHPLIEEEIIPLVVPRLFDTEEAFHKARAVFTTCFNPSQSKGFADVGRKFGVCRAATQNQGADMIRTFEMRHVGTWTHSGDPAKSEAATENAKTQHKKKKEAKCKPQKPSPFSQILN